jgi:predicted esterase
MNHRIFVVVIVLAACAAGCGGDDPVFDVTSTIVSHETTREVHVWAPDAEGPWPVVHALHGLGGRAEDMAIMAEELASRGFVVFAATGRTIEAVEQGRFADLARDTECGYRFARTIAEDYGGDLDQPVTMVGYSFGATGALSFGLQEATFGPGGTYEECFSGSPRPDVIVAVSGCHYEFEGNAFRFDTSGFGNDDATLVLVVGENDPVCAPWQSEDAADTLEAMGYDVDFVEIPNGNHFSVIFHDLVDDEWLTAPDEPAGHAVVETILDAIDAAR